MGAGGFAPSCLKRSRIESACAAAPRDLPSEVTGEGFRSWFRSPSGLPCEDISADLGLGPVAVGVRLTMVGAAGLAGAASFGGDGFGGAVLVGGVEARGVVACSRSRDNHWRWASILESSPLDREDGLGLDAGGWETLFRISAKRRKTSLALCGTGVDRVGDFTLGTSTGGNSVTRGVGGCGFTMIGRDAADGGLADRAPNPNMLLIEFDRPSCPRTVGGLDKVEPGGTTLGGLALG